MKMVIKVSRLVVNHRDIGREFARTVGALLQDGHFVTVVHGGVDCPEHSICAGNEAAILKHGDYSAENNSGLESPLAAAEVDNRMLVAILAQARISGLGLCATDAGLIQLRRRPAKNVNGTSPMEAAALNPNWLNVICSNKGVPVLSNVCLCACGVHHLIDPDQMSAVCAVNWDADALICLIEENGVLATDGTVIRWLDVESIAALQGKDLSDGMRRRLEVFAMALRKGVRRVKILPVSSIECLTEFYLFPIKHGTELISTSRSA
jgi:acetylglutamate kinase